MCFRQHCQSLGQPLGSEATSGPIQYMEVHTCLFQVPLLPPGMASKSLREEATLGFLTRRKRGTRGEKRCRYDDMQPVRV